MTHLPLLPLPPLSLLAKLRSMGPLRLLFLWTLSQAARALSFLVSKALPGSLGRWVRVSHVASLLSSEALRFEMWRRGSGFPRPGFSRALPTAEKLGRVALIAMGQSQSSWSDLDCRVDWLLLLSVEAERLASFDSAALPAHARFSLAQMPMLARHGVVGRFFEDELDMLAPLWREDTSPPTSRSTSRSTLTLRSNPLFAPGLNQQRAQALPPPNAPLHDELLFAATEAQDAITRARTSSRTQPRPPQS